MSLFRYQPRDYFYSSPMERFLVNALENTFGDSSFRRPLQAVAPYWLNQPVIDECNIGNAVGRVIDEKDKFAIEVDVSHFRPEDLSVSVRDRELIVEGHHKERTDQHGSGSIERHFIRKYVLPEGVQPETIESHLSDKGVLTVGAKKTAIGEPPVRNIPIRAAPKESQAVDQQKHSTPEA